MRDTKVQGELDMAGKGEGDTIVVEDDETVKVEVPDVEAAEQQERVTQKVEGDDEGAEQPPKRQRKPVTGVDLQAAEENSVDEAARQLQESLAKAKQGESAALQVAAQERERAEALAKQVQTKDQELTQTREQAHESQIAAIEAAIEKAKTEVATNEANYEAALSNGNFAEASKINTKLSRANATLERLEVDKQRISEKPEPTGATHEGRVEMRPAPAATPFERYVTDPQFTPKAQAWLRSHPDCVPATVGGDGKKNALMMAGHFDAVAKGLIPDTDEYFQHIETHIEGRAAVKNDDEGGQPQRQQKQQQRPVTPSAPASHTPPGGQQAPRNVREVRLTREQQEAAKLSFPHLPEKEALTQYAKNLVALQNEGKMGRTTH
jgi:hypothetical protein